jgi:multiple sugar transport system permease protein
MSFQRLSAPAEIGRHAGLLITAAVVLLPFVWMLSLSMKSPGEMFLGSFSLLPQDFYGFENYRKALTSVPLPRFLLNGVLVCASIVVLQLLICAPCAYALAKLKFRGQQVLFALVLIALLIPRQVLAVPLFVLGYKLGVLNSYVALIFPFIVSPFGIFLFRQFFKSIPDDIVQAARLDGMSELGIVWRVMVPMALPAVIAFVIFSVVSHWNDLFWPLIAVRSDALMPPALGIVSFRNEEAGTEYGPLMAGAVLVVAPLVLAFLFAQRRFIEGLTMGAIK